MVLTRDSQSWLHIKIPGKLLETAAIQAPAPGFWFAWSGEGLHVNSETLPWRFWCAARTGTTAQYPPMSSLLDIATWTWPLHGVEVSSCICSPVITHNPYHLPKGRSGSYSTCSFFYFSSLTSNSISSPISALHFQTQDLLASLPLVSLHGFIRYSAA